QDIVPDRAAGIHSIATVIGAKATVRVALALWTAAGLLMLSGAPAPTPRAAHCGRIIPAAPTRAR
ncbi:prenyltransferase, partial [Microbacterium esteraromaticum]|nr:prenyltransferase [Microbacterium esteraromaticum]